MVGSLNKEYKIGLRVLAKLHARGTLYSMENWKQLTKGLRKYESNSTGRGNIDFSSLLNYGKELYANALPEIDQLPEFLMFIKDLEEQELNDFYLIVCLLYRQQIAQLMEDDEEYIEYYKKLVRS
ncbi:MULTISPECIES: hypothetical protein [unclassified Tolypothrix]|uniref:hypothetical protein n=1 Tax=unclassified Tolypothrix TaxID=2649714 RepID=UPI0005EAA733|nr:MULTISPECIES: hypothetical protein [unclassified Tolypothrix]BAY91442.1 hypothetical protein NIES3275_34650 [Microchaete diplosiphon NIES-3275]EKF05518.1 hypothetical protein FDUTEX481_01691 [Tolypothrix sp. PCC 7601]MBE9086022.1 hypothetical protein [Tolypothrix sp. LEGE 11397]UYD25480.1 hypothetical protein HGR01_29675 [Tolypothrix sp. PCC 7712]UYD32280.1 hypothetical protein HG267_24880 [Tolypothrix sp. PCC 7601]